MAFFNNFSLTTMFISLKFIKSEQKTTEPAIKQHKYYKRSRGT